MKIKVSATKFAALMWKVQQSEADVKYFSDAYDDMSSKIHVLSEANERLSEANETLRARLANATVFEDVRDEAKARVDHAVSATQSRVIARLIQQLYIMGTDEFVPMFVHLRTGRKIAAIKYLRDNYKEIPELTLGLKECKDVIDALQARLKQESPWVESESEPEPEPESEDVDEPEV